VPLPGDLIHTPMIGLPGFRKELLRGLDDTSPGGTILVNASGFTYTFLPKMGGSTQTSSDPAQMPSDAPKPGTTVPFRISDAYAYQLSQVEGFPIFKLYWPVAQRNAALAVCKTYLRQYGDAYRSKPDDPYDDTIGAPEPGHASFYIPPLDHPATPDDVKAGRAIFTLPGTVRIWKMTSHPMGPAWQAEEVLIDGKWERYFGVIEDGKPKKVPADKIDFGGPNPPPKLTPQIAAIAEGPPIPGSSVFQLSYASRQFLPLHAPLPLTVSLINENGLDLPVPGALVISAGATKALPAGITLSASYSDKLPPVVQRFDEPPFEPAPYHDLPLKQGITVAPAQPDGPSLVPTVKQPILQIDLRDYFDLSRPGLYRIGIELQIPGQPKIGLPPIEFGLAS
jgi:hypothetical protein